MAASVLFEIKRKRRVTATKKSPFPLIFHLGTDDKASVVTWQFYRGVLYPDGVQVADREEIKALYYMGYFGKGSLSKSSPLFDRDAIVNGVPRKMSCRRYERHQKLHEQEMLEEDLESSSSKAIRSHAAGSSSDRKGRVVLVQGNDPKEDCLSSTSGESKPSDDIELLQEKVQDSGADIEIIEEKCSTVEKTGKFFFGEDPWPVDETLQLLFEEAFFLSYGLGCLIISEDNKELELLELWQRLCELSPDFPMRYTVYHHFRTKGWVVRSGAKYGVDYLLYKDGPPFYHATFSVIARQASSDSLQDAADQRSFSWTSLGGINRVNAGAMKTLLLCYVLVPSEADLSSPNSIKEFKVQEMLLRRWVTSEERNKKEEIP